MSRGDDTVRKGLSGSLELKQEALTKKIPVIAHDFLATRRNAKGWQATFPL